MSTATILSAFVGAMATANRIGDDVAMSRIIKVAARYERGLCSADAATAQLDGILSESGHAMRQAMQVFPVYVTVGTSNFVSEVPAYSNGGAENKVLDTLGGRCRRALAGDPTGGDFETMNNLYPDAVHVDATQIYRIEVDAPTTTEVCPMTKPLV